MSEDISILIERLKQMIYEKAVLMGVPFDREDIEAHELYDGHWVVALMWIKVPMPPYEDRIANQSSTKVRNVGLVPPPPQLVRFEPTDDPFVYTIRCYVPKVIVQNPLLVYTIHPDGTYVAGANHFIDWFEAEARRQAEADMEWAVSKTRERLKR